MSIELGKFNQLEVVKEVDFGLYLDGGDEGEILLPTRYVPEDCKVGDMLNVFLYLDIDERLIATTLTPLVQVGQFACLEVSSFGEGRTLPVERYARLCSGCGSGYSDLAEDGLGFQSDYRQ